MTVHFARIDTPAQQAATRGLKLSDNWRTSKSDTTGCRHHTTTTTGTAGAALHFYQSCESIVLLPVCISPTTHREPVCIEVVHTAESDKKFHLPSSCLPFSLSRAALSEATEAALAATDEL